MFHVWSCTIYLLLLTCKYDLSWQTNKQNGKERHVHVQLLLAHFKMDHIKHILCMLIVYQPHIWGSVMFHLVTVYYSQLPNASYHKNSKETITYFGNTLYCTERHEVLSAVDIKITVCRLSTNTSGEPAASTFRVVLVLSWRKSSTYK